MSVATSYARALYEAATEAKVGASGLDRLERELTEFAGALESSKDLQSALVGPVTSSKDKAAITQEIAKKMGLDQLVSRFLELMASKGRLGMVQAIRREFVQVRLAAEGGILGQLVAAEPMGESDIDSLAKAFADKLGKTIKFEVTTDPELLAGMKVTVNGVTYDGTLRAQLERLRDRFVIGTSQGAAH